MCDAMYIINLELGVKLFCNNILCIYINMYYYVYTLICIIMYINMYY